MLLPAEDHIPVLLTILERLPCLWICELSSCIHFDDSKLSVYHQRMNEQRPLLLRARWDGPLEEGANVKCKRKQCRRIRASSLRSESGGKLANNLETPKSRRGSFSCSEQSVESSVPRTPRSAAPYDMSSMLSENCQSLRQIRRVIRDEGLVATLKTEYLCTQWNQDGLHVKLYSNIISLRTIEATTPEEWTKTPHWQHEFPYAILMIDAKDCLLPPWLLTIIENYRVMNEFSKFLHATAVLYPELVQCQPHWVTPRTERMMGLRKGEDGVSLLNMLCDDLSPPSRMPPILEVNDPSTNFASSARSEDGDPIVSPMAQARVWMTHRWAGFRPKCALALAWLKRFLFPPVLFSCLLHPPPFLRFL